MNLGVIFKISYIRGHVRWVLRHHNMARRQVTDGGDGLQMWRVAANILNKQSRTADKRWSSSLGVGHGANNFSPYKISLLSQRASDLDSLDRRPNYLAQDMDQWRALVNTVMNLRVP
jgi:hypothetical protein